MIKRCTPILFAWIILGVSLQVTAAIRCDRINLAPKIYQFQMVLKKRYVDVPEENWNDLRSTSSSYYRNYSVDREGWLSSMNDYVKNLSKLQQEISGVSARASQIQRVFYPAFGTDVAMPLVTFPQVREILAYDEHELFSEEDMKNKEISVSDAEGGAWRAVQRIDAEIYTGPRILGSILALSPKAQINSIQLFVMDKTRPRVSGLIEFDLQDGVGARRLIYIAERMYTAPDMIKRFKPDAIVAKAAMQVVHDLDPKQNGIVIQTLKDQHGILLEGLAFDRGAANNRAYYQPEFSGKLIPVGTTNPQIYTGAQSTVIPNIPFGYREGALVSEF